jgi:type IV fimbrial biogenesis protein FimT
MKDKNFSNFQRGLSMVETMIALAIVWILIGVATPSFMEMQRKRQLIGISDELLSDIHFARSQAVAHNEGVRISVHPLASGGTCMVVHSGSTADCSCGASGPAVCVGGAQEIKTQRFAAAGSVQMSSSSASMRFDPVRGTVTPAGTLRLINADGRAINHVVSAMGRVRTCSPGATVSSYKPC